MKSKFFLFLLILAVGGLIFFAYPIIKQRYLTNNTKVLFPAPTEQEVPPPPPADADGRAVDYQAVPDEAVPETAQKSEKAFRPILKENCDTECAGFAGAELEYCREVCGLNHIQENIENCDGKQGLEKDYCLKDLGITKKDYSICEQITDKNVKATCNNRILEEQIDATIDNDLPG